MLSDSSTTLSQLSARPVLGVNMANVAILRLDLLGGVAPGNKVFKLRRSLQKAQAAGVKRVVSFGGAWSNHLHALAALGAELELETVGVIRGGEVETTMLAEVRRQGMQIEPVSRAVYRRRHELSWLHELEQTFAPCLVIPEGGAGADGVTGCLEIADMIKQSGREFDRILVSVGTGTTLAGLLAGLQGDSELVGVSALKGAHDLEARIQQLLLGVGLQPGVPWRLLHDEHCGGFARTSEGLRAFMLAFEAAHGILLEPVYTGKMLYALHRRLASREWSAAEPMLAVHTGGLQGRRGYAWLD